MKDPVDGVLAERQALDRGFGGSLVLSGFAHVGLSAVAVLAAFLAPRKPPLQVMDGFAVVLPRGGGGSPQVQAPPSTPPAPEPPVPEAPAPEPPPKILKPPKDEPKKGLPEPDAPRKKTKETKPSPAWTDRTSGRAQGSATTTGATSQTPGLEFAPPGPGVPGGADSGDWYMAGVQRKIWMLWMQQIKADFNQTVSVTFTILADGSVTGVQVTRPSGVALLDLAAQRSVMSAAPFRPLPKEYGTDRITIQANFKPNP